MPRLLKVLGSVTTGGGVAAGNIAANQAHPQLYRTLAKRNTFLAGPAAGLDLEVGEMQVLAFRHRSSLETSVG
jgi:hypothetical protein